MVATCRTHHAATQQISARASNAGGCMCAVAACAGLPLVPYVPATVLCKTPRTIYRVVVIVISVARKLHPAPIEIYTHLLSCFVVAVTLSPGYIPDEMKWCHRVLIFVRIGFFQDNKSLEGTRIHMCTVYT